MGAVAFEVPPSLDIAPKPAPKSEPLAELGDFRLRGLMSESDVSASASPAGSRSSIPVKSSTLG
jgi:hypothetical protein